MGIQGEAIGRREFSRQAVNLTLGSAISGLAFASASHVEARMNDSELSLSNNFLRVSWSISGGKLRPLRLQDRKSGRSTSLGSDALTLNFTDGRVLRTSQMALISKPVSLEVQTDPHSRRRASQMPGKQLVLHLMDPATGALIQWTAVLLDNTRYLRQEFSIQARERDLPIQDVIVWDVRLNEVQTAGRVKGSPAIAGQVFLAFEDPLSTTAVDGSRLRCALNRKLPLRLHHSFDCSSVIGVFTKDQLRREFLSYVEDQRAHPYRTFLHYNTWYDIGYFSRYDEASVSDRIDAFAKELSEQRRVVLDSLMLDDGWDDPASLWNFNSGFPNGLTRVADSCSKDRFRPGIWLSPWGGYGKPKQERLQYGRERGYEIEDGGFALSGPKYYEYFRDVCLRMIDKYGVNQFKIDGTGNANNVIPGSAFDSDFDAAISLIADLRSASPDLYINLTTGTYPSPFWLRFADSIWRGGEDHDFLGVGSWRQRWITYRDANTFQHTVKAGPLFPLNSLMLHGMIYAQHAKNLNSDPNGDFPNEIRSYFGTGTQLQEMYISPQLLSESNWDDLAEAANWSRRNAATLVDTHWIGGDPSQLQIYGWASWSNAKGIVTLRNPSDRQQAISIDIQQLFELPADAPQKYRAVSPWKNNRTEAILSLTAGERHEFQLAPFEVMTLEAVPAR